MPNVLEIDSHVLIESPRAAFALAPIVIHVEKTVYNPGDNNPLHTRGVVPPDPYSALNDLPYTVGSDPEHAGQSQGAASSKARTLVQRALHMVHSHQNLGFHNGPWVVSDIRGLGDGQMDIDG